MKTSALASIAILLVVASAPVHAQVYKWVDENGRTHYSDKAPQTVKKVDTVTADRVSIYTAPEMPASVQPAAPANGALNDRVDRLERQLYAEQLARREAELAAYAQPQDYYYYVPVVGGAPIRNRHDGFRRPGTKPAGVVGPGIMPGTFNGPNAITAGNVTLRTSLPASRGRGATSF
jgi:Domain of unknown function (DUF4124)